PPAWSTRSARESPACRSVRRCSAAASVPRPSTPCWRPGRPRHRRATGPGRARDPWSAWGGAAAAGGAGETSERTLRLLGFDAGDTLFVDGGAGGVGAVAVQMALARGAKVIASASAHHPDYLRELGATAVLYGRGLAERVRVAAGAP